MAIIFLKNSKILRMTSGFLELKILWNTFVNVFYVFNKFYNFCDLHNVMMNFP
jgi:hypothetical protein